MVCYTWLVRTQLIIIILTAMALCVMSSSATATVANKDISLLDEKAILDDAGMRSGLTLANCIKVALENNPDIAQKQWDIEISLAEKDIAKGQLWPAISVEAGYAHYLDYQRLVAPRRPGELSTFTDRIFSADIVLRMPLYTFGRLDNQVKASKYLAESVTHQFVRTRSELIFNVSKVFYSILGQREVVDSLVFSQKALQEHRKRVLELIDNQKAARVDLLRTEVRLADIEQKLLEERNILNIQKSLLTSLMGIEHPLQPIEVQGQLELKDFTVDINQSLTMAFSQRKDYQAARAKVDAQRENLATAKAGYFPIVFLEAAYGNRWAAGSTAGGPSTSEDVGRVGVTAEMPLFEGGQIEARIRRERSRLFAAREVLRKLKLQIQLEVETAVSNIESTKARVDSIKKAIEKAKESLRIERAKYDLGKGTIVDVLDAQAALLEAQTSFHRAMADYNVAIAQWRLAVGEEVCTKY